MKLDIPWPLSPVFFVSMWVIVSFITSRNGWRSFAEKYGAPTQPPGKSFASPSADFGTAASGYRNVMYVIFSNAGIHISAAILFRAFHAPFLIPWDKVKGLRTKKRFWITRQVLEIRDGGKVINIQLPEKALHEYELYKPA